MTFRETSLAGVWIVEPEPLADARGFFARTWCRREFEARGLDPALAQCSVSVTKRRGTVRGMHVQLPPHGEAKLVRCTRGAIHDVALDARRGSPTFGRWVAAELTADNHRMLYVPEGVAHGFQTLTDDAEVFYQISEFHHPESERGIRWDDTAVGIVWPVADVTVSPRDAGLPRLADL
jgi:dTDP-4-dehydrorhamnose 3,5-epimerase